MRESLIPAQGECATPEGLSRIGSREVAGEDLEGLLGLSCGEGKEGWRRLSVWRCPSISGLI